jgi:hypothetical protein
MIQASCASITHNIKDNYFCYITTLKIESQYCDVLYPILMKVTFILLITSHKWMKSCVNIVPLKTLYIILYGTVVFTRITAASSVPTSVFCKNVIATQQKTH